VSLGRDYLEIVLRLRQLVPGWVESYVGPAELLAAVDGEGAPSAAGLRERVHDFAERVRRERIERDRRRWLLAQLRAISTGCSGSRASGSTTQPCSSAVMAGPWRWCMTGSSSGPMRFLIARCRGYHDQHVGAMAASTERAGRADSQASRGRTKSHASHALARTASAIPMQQSKSPGSEVQLPGALRERCRPEIRSVRSVGPGNQRRARQEHRADGVLRRADSDRV
jgi:hypothetical protein